LTPFWIWALGRYFTEDNPQIQIPVSSVFSSLAVVTVPVVAGLLVHRCNPEAAKRIASILKPFTGLIGYIACFNVIFMWLVTKLFTAFNIILGLCYCFDTFRLVH